MVCYDEGIVSVRQKALQKRTPALRAVSIQTTLLLGAAYDTEYSRHIGLNYRPCAPSIIY